MADNRVLISGDLGYAVQRQGDVVVIQCWECGEHTKVITARAARRWQAEHTKVCKGDA